MNKPRLSSLPPEALCSNSKALRIPRHHVSGSETDVSGSSEGLSAEERHTLRHTQRQEPQGEEQIFSRHSIATSDSDILSRRSSAAPSLASQNESNLSIGSSSNTLIIHHSVPDEPWSNRLLSNYLMTSNSRRNFQERSNGENVATESSQKPNIPEMTAAATSSQPSAHSLYLNTTADMSNNSGIGLLKTSLQLDRKHPISSFNTQQALGHKYVTSTVLNEIPHSYLDQSEVLKHLLNKESKDLTKISVSGSSVSTSGAYSDQSNSSSNSGLNLLINENSSGVLPAMSKQLSLDKEDLDISSLINKYSHPPPPYRHWQLENSNNDATELKDVSIVEKNRSMDKNSFSRSQPDLSHLGTPSDVNAAAARDLFNRLRTTTLDDDDPVSLKEMVEILTRENATLKLEVDLYHRKVYKLQKFELEMTKVEEQHEALVKSCERREQLERLARHKLQAELRRLTDLNNELKEQVELLSGQLTSRSTSVIEDSNSDSSALKRELNKRDVCIAQLVSQNKELVAAKERQEIELTAQRQTLNEQRTHIDILDSALTNAQTNVVKLEEEVRKKQSLVDQAAQFKRLLLNMQLASDRREQSEKNLRQRLENELLQLRSNVRMDHTNTDIAELKKDVKEKDEKILQLEAEVQSWELRFLQDPSLGYATAAESNPTPRDAKLSSIERTNFDNDRKLSQAKSEKIRQFDELHNLTKKISDVESRNRSLESRLAEREAMIRALQKRAEEKEVPSHVFQKNQGGPAAPSNVAARSNTLDEVNVLNICAQSVGPNPITSISLPIASSPSTVAPSLTAPRRDEELDYNPSSPPPFRHLRAGSFAVKKLPEDKMATQDSSYFVEMSDPASNVTFIPDVSCSSKFPSIFYSSRDKSENMDFYKELNLPPQDNFASNSNSKALQNPPPYQMGSKRNVLPSVGYYFNEPPFNYEETAHHAISKPSSPPDYALQVQINPNFCQDSPVALKQTNKADNCTDDAKESIPPKDNPPEMTRGDPPPYHGHHQGIKQPKEVESKPCPKSPPLFPRPLAVCQKPHPPNAFCRTCQSVRRSHRQNAAALVRRANSSGCQYHRRSAPSPSSSGDSLDDAPSILERLKKEWEMGMLGCGAQLRGGEGNTCKADGSKTLPHPLHAVLSSSDKTLALGTPKEVVLTATSAAPPSAKVDSEADGSSDNKKDAAHLDRALNRLSIRRANQKHTTAIDSSDVVQENNIDIAHTDKSNFFNKDINSDNPFDSHSDNVYKGISFDTSHLLITEDADLEATVFSEKKIMGS